MANLYFEEIHPASEEGVQVIGRLSFFFRERLNLFWFSEKNPVPTNIAVLHFPQVDRGTQPHRVEYGCIFTLPANHSTSAARHPNRGSFSWRSPSYLASRQHIYFQVIQSLGRTAILTTAGHFTSCTWFQTTAPLDQHGVLVAALFCGQGFFTTAFSEASPLLSGNASSSLFTGRLRNLGRRVTPRRRSWKVEFACDSASVDSRLRLRPPTVVNLKLGPLLPSVARGPPGEERPRTEDLDLVLLGFASIVWARDIRPTTKQTLTAAESEEDEGKGNTPLPFVFGVACLLNVTLLTEIKWSTSSILSGLRSACRRPKPASGDDSEGGALTRLHRSVTVGQDSSAKLRRSGSKGVPRDEGGRRKEEGERDRGAGCHAFLLWAELKHGSRPSAAVVQPFADILLHRPLAPRCP
ncbi:hypothetical protein B0H13DRAFT_2520695 [Mycena leptocephala]|nr:hypothetical protein B0H13DRAFT_2520695 [Mycena leptocephala]